MSNEKRELNAMEQFGIRLTPELKEKHIVATKLEEQAAEMDVVARDEVERAARLIREAKAAAELAENKAIILDKEELMEQEIKASIIKDEQELEAIKAKLEEDKVRHTEKLEDIKVASEEARNSKIQANELSEVANEALETARKIVLKAQLLKVESETARAEFISEVERIHWEKRVEEAKIAEENAKKALEIASIQKDNADISKERYDLLKQKLEEASKYDIDLDMDIKTLSKNKQEFEDSLNEVNDEANFSKKDKKSSKKQKEETVVVEEPVTEEQKVEIESNVENVIEETNTEEKNSELDDQVETFEEIEIQEPADDEDAEFDDEVISNESYSDPFNDDEEVEYKETTESNEENED